MPNQYTGPFLTPEEKREHQRLNMARWRANNPEKAKEISQRAEAKRKGKRPRNPEQAAARTRKWREKNPEHAREIGRRSDAKRSEKRRDYKREIEKARYWQNPELEREQARMRRAEAPEINRHYKLRTIYGITFDQYLAMFEEQKGLCAACLELPKEGEKLVVDHEHTTNMVRGLVHNTCNVAKYMQCSNRNGNG